VVIGLLWYLCWVYDLWCCVFGFGVVVREMAVELMAGGTSTETILPTNPPPQTKQQRTNENRSDRGGNAKNLFTYARSRQKRAGV